MPKQIYFSAVTKPDFKFIENLLLENFETGQLSNFGPVYERFHSDLKKYLLIDPRDEKELIITNSGHSALMTAYHIFGIKRPLIPDYTFESTRSAAKLQGIEPKIIDVDYETGCLCLKDIEKIDLKDYDSIVLVAALSNIPEIEKIYKYCRKNKKILIVDGAATFGSQKDLWKHCDAYCYSFHATKTFGIGEGGAIVFNRTFSYKAKAYINFGIDPQKSVFYSGINGKISEYACAIGVDLLRRFDEITERRKKNTDIYENFCKETGIKTLKKNISDIAYQTFPIFIENKVIREKIKTKLKENLINFGQYYKPLSSKKNSSKLFLENICLPCHQGLEEKDIFNICELMKLEI